MARKGQEFRTFTPEFKAKAVRMYHSGMSMREITRELSLVNSSYVYRWVKAYKEKGAAGLKDHRGLNGGIRLGATRSQKPELRIKWLEAEVALLKKIAAWERGNARKEYCLPLSEN